MMTELEKAELEKAREETQLWINNAKALQKQFNETEAQLKKLVIFLNELNENISEATDFFNEITNPHTRD